jgi:putative spermidine/putrescine transport system ATP-binding protein
VDVVVRQEAIGLHGGPADNGALRGVVALRSFNGARVQYVVRLDHGIELVAEATSSGVNSALAVGSEVSLSIDPCSIFATPAEAAA